VVRGRVRNKSVVEGKMYQWERPWTPLDEAQEPEPPQPRTASLFATTLKAPEDQKLTSEESTVLRVLDQHRGKERAITAHRIAGRIEVLVRGGLRTGETSWDARRVRLAISSLRRKGHLIGSSVHKPHLGFYMITTRAEFEEVRRVLHQRAMEILMVDKAMRRAWQEQYGEELQPLLFNLDELEHGAAG